MGRGGKSMSDESLFNLNSLMLVKALGGSGGEHYASMPYTSESHFGETR